MISDYRKLISRLIAKSPFDIDAEAQIKPRKPTSASSAFLTNKQQGDWAEKIILDAIDEHSEEFRALKYGRDDSLDAGDPGFDEFFEEYKNELNIIGKKPDILVFRRDDVTNMGCALDNHEFVRTAIAAIEVRSSSFLKAKYSDFMNAKTQRAEIECLRLQQLILQEPYSKVLAERRPELHKMISGASIDTFRELDFRVPGWYASPVLRELNEYMRELKFNMDELKARSYLSITPKLEDIVVVNRWIQNFGVPHYYLQVFFDKAYIISFKDILEITSDPNNEDVVFSVERDVKNQGKTTIKIDVQVGEEILRRIDMPNHQSELKEQERGRLLYYVTFQGGKGYLDAEIFSQEIINGA